MVAKKSSDQRPFLKWAGGKYRLLERIRAELPKPSKNSRLIEPFVGAGALFANSGYQHCIINDANADLIHIYRILKSDHERYIKESAKLFSLSKNNPDHYYKMRERLNQSGDHFERAVLFLYLNRHGYNGLCRYNQKGGFNVPFGRYKRPYFPENELRHFSNALQQTKIQLGDYGAVITKAKAGDVVYCDPPYAPLTATSNFTNYARGGFPLEEQRRLANMAEKAADRGVLVVISNHSTAFTKEIYASAD
ncbi:MAG: Dam family site-specific DNA-(adenine-N6)-methyltransferase, partial [Chromatiales bacterium]|nr:Dam family site-specific DNA-(adenine-N6)-methyltransferase [Chromatiales bacterium]